VAVFDKQRDVADHDAPVETPEAVTMDRLRASSLAMGIVAVAYFGMLILRSGEESSASRVRDAWWMMSALSVTALGVLIAILAGVGSAVRSSRRLERLRRHTIYSASFALLHAFLLPAGLYWGRHPGFGWIIVLCGWAMLFAVGFGVSTLIQLVLIRRRGSDR